MLFCHVCGRMLPKRNLWLEVEAFGTHKACPVLTFPARRTLGMNRTTCTHPCELPLSRPAATLWRLVAVSACTWAALLALGSDPSWSTLR